MGESQSNGRVEGAIRRLKGQIRTIKDYLEHMIKAEIPSDSCVLQWLVKWAATSISRFAVGKDGFTAYEKMRGRKCNICVTAFGEAVQYKELQEGKKPSGMECQWKDGMWLGINARSNESIIGTSY